MKKTIFLFLCIIAVILSCTIGIAAETSAANTTDTASESATVNESDPVATEKVSGIKAEKADAASITLTWNEISGADGYKVYGKTESAEKYKLLATVEKPSAVIKELKSGTVYCFKIKAYRKNADEKAVSGPASEEYKAVTAPPKIKRIVTQAITKDSITLLWSACVGATHYEISYFSRQDNRFIIYGVVEGKQSFTIADLMPGRIYTFRIRPVKVYGEQNAFGAYSDDYSEFTDKDGTPYTKAQIAERYNREINSLKQTADCRASYTKEISTLVLDCSKLALVNTCKNIMSLFDGQMKKSLTFQNGTSGSYTMNSLIEPYSRPAALKGNDILSFRYKKNDENTYYEIKLRSDSTEYKNQKTAAPKQNKTVVSSVALQKLRITPVRIKNATQIFDGVQIKLKLSNDGTKKVLGLTNPVLVKADCKVSTVDFSVDVMYEIRESYGFVTAL